MEKCYCCRNVLNQPHHSYKKMCEACGEQNLYWRNLRDDLTGYIALITGARIKIGYYTTLRLLRNGATVIATTRFPYSAHEIYRKEPDFNEWSDRLNLYGLDLLRIDLLGNFIEMIYDQYGHLDILINNAAQTVKDNQQIHEQMALEASLKHRSRFQLPGFIQESVEKNELMLYQGLNLQDSQQNAWMKFSQDISIRDLLEIQIINVTAPFLLTTGFKSLLARSPHKNKFVINVSSVEGKFNMKKKSSAHSHTNMAKAALNMMTKSLSREYKANRIALFSVDPGWVSNQFPADHPVYIKELPLDFTDAAARILHPVFRWKNEAILTTGVFLKDFAVTEW